MKIRDSCLCGSVRYEVQGPLTGAGPCHCPMCRKWSGAACGTGGFIAPEQFRWTAGEDLVERYPSSPGKDRCFCRRCGSPLVAAHGVAISEVVLGSIDGDPMVRPREHICGTQGPMARDFRRASPAPRVAPGGDITSLPDQ